MEEKDFVYNENQEYLQGAIDCKIMFVNIDNEIAQFKKSVIL